MKPWWPGDPRVEKYMPRVREALGRHEHLLPQDARTDIYNRAYEAVYYAIIDAEKLRAISSVLAKPEGAQR